MKVWKGVRPSVFCYMCLSVHPCYMCLSASPLLHVSVRPSFVTCVCPSVLVICVCPSVLVTCVCPSVLCYPCPSVRPLLHVSVQCPSVLVTCVCPSVLCYTCRLLRPCFSLSADQIFLRNFVGVFARYIASWPKRMEKYREEEEAEHLEIDLKCIFLYCLSISHAIGYSRVQLFSLIYLIAVQCSYIRCKMWFSLK